MSRASVVFALAALLALSLAQTLDNARPEEPVPPALVVWQGEMEVNGSVIFTANQTLVIMPGTIVRIRTVEPSCTEGSAPVITVLGDLVADGNDTARIRFVSVTADGAVCTAGREALLIYSGQSARNQSLTSADFTGGTLLCYQTALSVQNCTFNHTQVRFSGDNSTVEGCTFLDSPLSVFPRSATIISNNTFTRTAQDESGIYLYDSAAVLNNTISNCVSGIEAYIWISGTVAGNTITGCLEAVNSTGALDIGQNRLTGNGIGVRSWSGLDRLDGNLIAGNDIGIASLGRLAGTGNNTFRTPGGTANRLADVQELVLVSGQVVDGNGQTLFAAVTIRDSTGRTLFTGDPKFLALTAWEKLPDGTERRYSPFNASTTVLGASNSTVLDGNFSIGFTVRLDLYPDLIVQSFRGPLSGAAAGDRVPLTMTVRNTGNVPAHDFQVAASVDGEPAYLVHVNSLKPGEGRNLTFEWTASAGTHSFKAMADSTAAVSELSEKDNSRSIRAEIRAPVSARAVPLTLPLVLLIVAGMVILVMTTPRE